MLSEDLKCFTGEECKEGDECPRGCFCSPDDRNCRSCYRAVEDCRLEDCPLGCECDDSREGEEKGTNRCIPARVPPSEEEIRAASRRQLRVWVKRYRRDAKETNASAETETMRSWLLEKLDSTTVLHVDPSPLGRRDILREDGDVYLDAVRMLLINIGLPAIDNNLFDRIMHSMSQIYGEQKNSFIDEVILPREIRAFRKRNPINEEKIHEDEEKEREREEWEAIQEIQQGGNWRPPPGHPLYRMPSEEEEKEEFRDPFRNPMEEIQAFRERNPLPLPQPPQPFPLRIRRDDVLSALGRRLAG